MVLGSSPLTRGKHGQGDEVLPVAGLIPAHAGKTRWWSGATHWWPAHPRSRGENFWLHCRHVTRAGSSPLTRGKHTGLAVEHPEDGLIPAHAGKTAPAPTSPTSRRAHPRSRGENEVGPERLDTTPGSSPLTRGKLGGGLLRRLLGRLIPAHAGKTNGTTSRVWKRTAHPRSRGENRITS